MNEYHLLSHFNYVDLADPISPVHESSLVHNLLRLKAKEKEERINPYYAKRITEVEV
jgi:hypothetical protein